jgi:AcrR family transcriptional regulator
MSRQPRAKRPYHHGDLRRAVLDGALAAIETSGPAALSLREVARRAGVSHAAPAHHFRDKPGVLTAIAAEGFTRIAEEMRSAASTTGSGLIEAGTAYIRFALTHRAYFEVMFSPDLYRPDDPQVAQARQAAADVLFELVRSILGHANEQEIWGGVIAAWSFTHGFATLSLNANFNPQQETETDTAVHLAAAATVQLVAAGAFNSHPRTA